jgi:gamma-glutamylcysteine synthetase
MSLSARSATDLDAPIESVDAMVDFLRHWEKPQERWRVGTEHEKIGVYGDGHDPVPFESGRGIGALLERIADIDGWTRVSEGAHVIALEKDGASTPTSSPSRRTARASRSSRAVSSSSPAPRFEPSTRPATSSTRTWP